MSDPRPDDVGSVSFDRAAEFYDTTRLTARDGLEGALELLDAHLPAGGLALEIGVGTGALAVPLAERGRRVVGLDLSEPMLRKLIGKDVAGRVRPIRGDATRLPFAHDAFRGAYCRWVLHLIAAWPEAVAELCRVVRAGGTIAVNPGGYTGEWRVVWLRTIHELGPGAQPVGLQIPRDEQKLNEAFSDHGAGLVGTEAAQAAYEASLARFFDEAGRRMYSWTWRVPDDVLERGLAVARAWAAERYGDLHAPFDPLTSHPWRIYRVGVA